MREIEFRGMRVDNKKWQLGSLVKYSSEYFIQYETTDWYALQGLGKIEQHKIKVISNTVGQFTGLTDKNGKKIFEGDIVKLTSKAWSERNFECIVKFGEFKIYDLSENGTDGEPACKEDIALEFCIGWYSDCGDDDYYYQCMAINKATFIQYDVEVIGNIHEEATK